MRPKTLSATAAQVYEKCPARYKAEQIDRAPGVVGVAADLGSVCHKALELFVVGGHHLAEGDTLTILRNLYENAYYEAFAEPDRYEQGLAMLTVWHARQDWTDRTVLSTEVKKHFELPTPDGGKIKFNYVMDRVDRLGNEEIEVVDYKTSVLPIKPEDLRHRLQARAYAVAAQIEHPDAPRIWVTFDMLRHDAVGVVFTKEENRATWRYLTRLVERIFADDEAKERLNDECRWCIRRPVCKALRRHVNAGGPLSLTDPAAAVDLHYELTQQQAGIKTLIGELEDFILTHCEREKETSIVTDNTVMEVGVSSRRYVNPEQVQAIIGADLFGRYGKMNMGAVDDLLKGPDLTDEQKAKLRRTIGRQTGEPNVNTKQKPPEEFK